MPSLILKKNNQVIKEFIITKPRLILGRGIMGNDLEIPDGLASRQHCEIKKDGDTYTLTDLRSSNGTILNKKTITSTVLKNNDEIQIGLTSIIFKDDSPAQKSASSPATSSDIVRGLNEIPMEYRLNIKDMQDAGQSLAAAPISIGMKDEKGSKKFFMLYQLGKAVSSATTVDEVLDVAMYSIFDSIKAERGVIMLIDKATGQTVPRLSRIRSQKDLKEHFTVSHTIINKVITAGINSAPSSQFTFAKGRIIMQLT